MFIIIFIFRLLRDSYSTPVCQLLSLTQLSGICINMNLYFLWWCSLSYWFCAPGAQRIRAKELRALCGTVLSFLQQSPPTLVSECLHLHVLLQAGGCDNLLPPLFSVFLIVFQAGGCNNLLPPLFSDFLSVSCCFFALPVPLHCFALPFP